MRALGDYVADDATGTERGDLWPAAKATSKIRANRKINTFDNFTIYLKEKKRLIKLLICEAINIS